MHGMNSFLRWADGLETRARAATDLARL